MALVNRDEEDFLSADSAEALLDQFLEYEAQHGETPATSLTSTSKVESADSSHFSLRTAVSSTSRKRQSGRSPPPFTASPTKSRRKHSLPDSLPVCVTDGGTNAPTLRHLLTGGPESPTLPVCGQTHNDIQLNSLLLTRKEQQKDVTAHNSVVPEGDLRTMTVEKPTLLIPHKKPVTQEEDREQKQSRRVVFLGNLPSTVSDMQILQNFSHFGQIEDINLHSRTAEGIYYAFITFKDKSSADKAVTEGSLPGVPDLDLSYGGRRRFCGRAYVDHDMGQVSFRTHRKAKRRQMSPHSASDQDFDTLLHEYTRKTA